ncbi:hypothetical protein F5141DRAFT_1290521 [Pisolithus sp. B1]|nr:hypothetical protein F5141DRAFT_1290521 [Pisolithus sp. B1]
MSDESRKLDVTCCNIEIAVLARNTLLFTPLATTAVKTDRQVYGTSFRLRRAWIQWKQGPHSHIIVMCGSDTLSEIGRFWKLWLGTPNLDPKQTRRFKEIFQDGIRRIRKPLKASRVITSIRSAGRLAPVAMHAVSEQFKRFWATGVTDDELPNVKPANRVNPTFSFSTISGDEFSLPAFHLAEILASSGLKLTRRHLQSSKSCRLHASSLVPGAKPSYIVPGLQVLPQCHSWCECTLEKHLRSVGPFIL